VINDPAPDDESQPVITEGHFLLPLLFDGTMVPFTYPFTPSQKAELIALLQSSIPNPDAFVDDLAIPASVFRTLKQQHNDSPTQTQICDRLRKLHRTLDQTRQQLLALTTDSHVQSHLGITGAILTMEQATPAFHPPIDLPPLITSIDQFLVLISRAVELSIPDERGGRPANPYPVAFVERVAKLWHQHTQHYPSSTEGNAFEQFVDLLLKHLGWHGGNCHQIIVQALRQAKGSKTPI